MERKNEMAVITFRATDEQVERLRKISKATGKRTSTVLRDIVDSALLIERPLVASNYQGGPVQHGA